MDVGDGEQLRTDPAAGVDQRAHIGPPGGDDAIERGDDPLEPFLRLQPRDVRLCGVHLGHFRLGVARLHIDVLDRDSIGLQQLLPTPRGDLRKPVIGLGNRQIGLRADEVLVEVRRFDGRQQFAGRHPGTDVLVPHLQIAADPGIDRRLEIRLDRSG